MVVRFADIIFAYLRTFLCSWTKALSDYEYKNNSVVYLLACASYFPPGCLLWEMIWSEVDSLKIARSQGSS